ILVVPEQFRHRLFEKHFAVVFHRFEAALDRALPKLPLVERRWRQVFSIGVMTHILLLAHVLPSMANGVCDPSDGRALTRWMVAFVSAGLRAPATEMAAKAGRSRKAGD
ncbi:MAG: hypothetical protein ACRD9L_10200, partial [Bryobacteraceae bacterium]